VCITANFGNQTFRREAGSLIYGGPDDSAQRQYRLVDGQKVDNVTHLASSSCGHRFIHRQVGGVKNVAEQFIAHRREKSVIAVNDPLEARTFGALPDCRYIDQGQLAEPLNLESTRLKYCRVPGRGMFDSLRTIMKYVDST
jgi:hypothetical protein